MAEAAGLLAANSAPVAGATAGASAGAGSAGLGSLAGPVGEGLAGLAGGNAGGLMGAMKNFGAKGQGQKPNAILGFLEPGQLTNQQLPQQTQNQPSMVEQMLAKLQMPKNTDDQAAKARADAGY